MDTDTPRKVDLIGVASGMGGADAACAQGPARLSAAGLAERLRDAGIDAAWVATLEPRHDHDGLDSLSHLNAELAARVAKSARAGRLPCVIGGDHSCAVGTWSGAATALQTRGPLGLVWIDAHMDSSKEDAVPGTNPSGRTHGMPLAALLGHGDSPLTGLHYGTLRPRHVCLVGVRSYEPAEAALLERLGVTVIGIQEVARRGLAQALDDAVAIASDGTTAYGVTLDLDALDPSDAPAVATPALAGIAGDALVSALARVGADPRLAAFELAEYCPRLDRDGASERLIFRLLCAALGGSAENSQVLADAVH